MTKRFLNGFAFGIASILFISGIQLNEIFISYVSLVAFPMINFSGLKDFRTKTDFVLGTAIALAFFQFFKFIVFGI